MYIYEGHLGSLYVTDEPQSYEELYCEECGDSDRELGCANTAEKAWGILKDVTDINGSGGWAYDYVKGFLERNFGDSSMMPAEEADS